MTKIAIVILLIFTSCVTITNECGPDQKPFILNEDCYFFFCVNNYACVAETDEDLK
jgi:hypothetical protein